MTGLALFRKLIPSLAAESDARVDCFLELASTTLCAAAFGGQFPRAAVYWSAHYLVLEPEDGSGDGASTGAVTARKTGDESINFGTMTVDPSAPDSFFQTTRFGMSFLQIRDTRAATAPNFLGFGC